ncbi:MAG TPA: serine hydrolase [Micromonosporaceae bacterium]|nr:serine hydrolase [Micromonosporaceae bacterium]
MLRVALAVTVVVLGLAALRYLPGSPLAASAAPAWVPPPGGASAPASNPGDAPTPTPTPTEELEPLSIGPAKVSVQSDGWVAWAWQDLRTGKIYGSKNMGSTSTTASLVKAWIGADYLRRAAEQGRTPNATQMRMVSIMIRDSDNEAASTLFDAVGGRRSTERMIEFCGMTDSKASSNWSITRLSPRDITRLGACLLDGRAAGPKWTKYLISEMRQVRGVGDFGIRKAFPAKESKTIAIKNGWVTRDNLGEWHVNCLAIGDGWTMGVMTRYPTDRDYTYGAELCKNVAAQLRTK